MLEFLFRMKRRNTYSNFRFYLYEICSVIGWILGSKVCNVRALQLTLCRVSIVSIGFTRTIVIVFSSRCRRSMIRCFPMILCDPAYRLAMRIFQGQPERIYIKPLLHGDNIPQVITSVVLSCYRVYNYTIIVSTTRKKKIKDEV